MKIKRGFIFRTRLSQRLMSTNFLIERRDLRWASSSVREMHDDMDLNTDRHEFDTEPVQEIFPLIFWQVNLISIKPWHLQHGLGGRSFRYFILKCVKSEISIYVIGLQSEHYIYINIRVSVNLRKVISVDEKITNITNHAGAMK